MLNTEPIYFNDPVYYPQLIIKKSRYSKEEIMLFVSKSKDKARAKEYQDWITLNKNPFNTIFLFTHGQCTIQIGPKNYSLKPNHLVIIPQHIVYSTSCSIEHYDYSLHFKTEYVLPFLKIGSLEDVLPFTIDDSKYITSLTADQAKSTKILF